MITCKISQRLNRITNGDEMFLEFFTDTGKFGSEELLDDYELTAEQLLDILQEWRNKE